MRRPLSAADEDLAAWIERWVPTDLAVFDHWRASLPPELRREALFPLQAALSGLDALRSFENQSLETATFDFHDHLYGACATYGWALRLSDELRAGSREVGVEPLQSLDALRVSLADAAHVSDRLLELSLVDAGSFHSTCDMFLRDLSRNDFFRAPRALEVSNDPFLTLLRAHRFVGIAALRLDGEEGASIARVVVAAVRRDLRELVHFMNVNGNDSATRDLSTVLSLVDADDMLLGIVAREPDASMERFRNRLDGLRGAIKSAAKRLRGSGDEPERAFERSHSERVPVDLTPEIWAFRFIVHAFLAKISALSEMSEPPDESQLAFVPDFVGHFRAFGPRLAKGTDYPARAALVQAVSAISHTEDIDAQRLERAFVECDHFAEHLESVLSERVDAETSAFDKERAAEELRVYLEGVRSQPQRVRELG
jgi:hypothetical protein